MSAPAAAYDPHADWYEHYVEQLGPTYTARRGQLLADLLGPGSGRCLDICCGTGASAAVLRERGWIPVGVDLSAGQLRYGATRLPVARADATRLPIRDASVPAAVCVLAHTDLPDYPAVLREAARILQPGGRFVHLGVHPCFVGAFADWSDPEKVLLDHRYADRSHTHDAWSPAGVRARVGAWHTPLADLFNDVLAAGLRLVRVVESGGRAVPDLLGLVTRKA